VELADWWEDFHLGNDDDREAMLRDLKTQAPSRSRRAPATAVSEVPEAQDEDVDGGLDLQAGPSDAAAPRKRRRRRRKPGGGGGAGGGESEGPPARVD
jgi:poly(A) polymerase